MARRWARLSAVGLSAALLAAACGTGADVDTTERDARGRIVAAGRVGTLVLRQGDCFREPAGEVVTRVEGVPCGRPHDGQVVATFELAAGDDEAWPGTDALTAGVTGRCLDLAVEAIGDPARTAGLSLAAYVPDADSWDAGDRGVVCWVRAADGSPLSGDVLSAGA